MVLPQDVSIAGAKQRTGLQSWDRGWPGTEVHTDLPAALLLTRRLASPRNKTATKMGVFHSLLGGAVCGFCHIPRYSEGGTPPDMAPAGGLAGGLLVGRPPQPALSLQVLYH